MKRIFTFLACISLVFFVLTSCKPKQQIAAVKGKPVLANVPIIIYKTKQDYSQQVPVTMSADKMSIVSYPAPSDVYYGAELAYPVTLKDGYFLDKRGVDQNSAFTKWTYYEYSRLQKTPTQEEIKKMLLETDPFTEMWYCGTRNDFKDLENELNNAIVKGKLSKFKRLK